MSDYKAVFFDWDGTAVTSRKAPVDEAAAAMKRLLGKGIKLAVISGTTLENIGGGNLHTYFSVEERQNLYYGLGRGAYNYGFLEEGDPVLLSNAIPDRDTLLSIHRVCYEIHEYLLREYGFPTDIVFSRPNYCKIDLMAEVNRGDHLFFQAGELEALKAEMEARGMAGGPAAFIRIAERIGGKHGLRLSATTDAKYLEVGPTNKSDNVDFLLGHFKEKFGIEPLDCAFWGDEYIGMDEGLYGSDSFMITELSKDGRFFDVSFAEGKRPSEVTVTGGGVERFLEFLRTL